MLIDLNDKRVLFGITGSISAYKACDIARLLVKSGADVRVVMTDAAERFVSALTLEALTRNPVLTEKSESWSSDLNHIDIVKDTDVFLIAPITANSINKLSKGIADNILLQAALAYGGKMVIAPAANTQMLASHYTDGSLKMLAVNDVKVVSPQTKILACGDEGNGALAEPLEIYYQVAQALLEDPFWKDRKVVITGGGTREKIDEVRYISNYSSGKMAKSLATILYCLGADICYISTMPHDELPQEIYTIDVEDAKEMLEYTVDSVRVAKKGKMSRPSLNNPNAMAIIQKTPFLFMVAAVADYTPAYPQQGKLKKDTIGNIWNIELKQTEDILNSINKDGIITVGFKAEMDKDNGLENAKNLIANKQITAVCYNLLKNSQSFGSDDNRIIWITKDTIQDFEKIDKLALSLKIATSSKMLDGDSNG